MSRDARVTCGTSFIKHITKKSPVEIRRWIFQVCYSFYRKLRGFYLGIPIIKKAEKKSLYVLPKKGTLSFLISRIFRNFNRNTSYGKIGECTSA